MMFCLYALLTVSPRDGEELLAEAGVEAPDPTSKTALA
jgi:hypothetical protein